MTDAFPLAWPDGWPRTRPSDQKDGRYQFKRPSDRGWREPWTFAAAREALLSELLRIADLQAAVISSNWPMNTKGHARADARRPMDEGIAIYFKRGDRQFAMACDRYTRAEENMRSLTLALEAMRQLERHGGGTMVEKAFAGFVALPPPKSHWAILGVEPGASASEVERAYRARVREAHPDTGGSHAAMSELNEARDKARKALA